MCVLPMYKELENRNPRRFGRSGFLAHQILFALLVSDGRQAKSTKHTLLV